MKTFHKIINTIIDCIFNLKGLAYGSLVLLSLAILCMVLLSYFSVDTLPCIMGLDITTAIIKTIGFFGLLNWIGVVSLSVADRSKFDRNMAHANFSRLIYILFLVASIPCILFLFFDKELPNANCLDHFNNTVVNPFLNHGNFDNGMVPSLISLIGTFLLSGILVSLLVSFINQRSERWEKGELRYPLRFCKYRIVIGGHDAVPSLVKQLLEKYNEKVIVFTNRDIPSFRCEVESYIEKESQKEKVVFYHGYRTSETDLKKLHLGRNKLRAIYILGETHVHGEAETSHDTLNMTCVDIINGLRGEGKTQIPCYVFFEHQTTSIVFQKFANSQKYKSLDFIPYNFYELQAQKAIGWSFFLKHEEQQVNPFRLDRFGTDVVNADKHVHLVVVGMSKMGQALGLEAIRVCHYPNYAKAQMSHEYKQDVNAEEKMKNRRTKITFIDCNMKEIVDSFKCKYGRLLNEVNWNYYNFDGSFESQPHPLKTDDKKTLPDIELEFVNGRIQSEDVINYLTRISADIGAVLTIASCLSKSNQSIASILCLPKVILEKAEILIYQPDSTKLVESIAINGDLEKVRAFGEISQAVNLKHIIALESMAKRINYVYDNKDLLKKEIRKLERENLVESIKTVWENFASDKDENIKECENKWKNKAETWRWANRYHASAIWQKIHYIDNLDNVVKITILGITDNDGCVQKEYEGLMARVEHNRYCIEQWLLDRKESGDASIKNYISLKNDKDKDNSGREFTEFPTNDQIMTMAIPYIIGDSIS